VGAVIVSDDPGDGDGYTLTAFSAHRGPDIPSAELEDHAGPGAGDSPIMLLTFIPKNIENRHKRITIKIPEMTIPICLVPGSI
jgi:hypothetical protein